MSLNFFSYDELAPLYKQKAIQKLDLQKNLLQPIIDDCKRVLDVGCGVGIVSLALPHLCVVGVDESAEMIRIAKELSPTGKFECADWLCCDPPCFDFVSAQAYLHLFPPSEASLHLRKMLSVATRRCFVTTTLHQEFWAGQLPKEGAEHVVRFRVQHTEKSWLSLMRSAAQIAPFVIYKQKDLQRREWLCTLFFDNFPQHILKKIYENTGYLQIYNFENVAPMLPVCQQIVKEPCKNVLRYEVASGFDRAEGMIHFAEMRDVESRMQKLLTVVAGKETTYFKDKLNVKQSGREPFPPHQDIAAGWSKYAKEHFTVALALEECSNESGALQVIEQPCDQQSALDGPNPLEPNGYHRGFFANKEWKTLEMNPGDIVLFSSKLIHCSGANTSPHSRMLWLVTFVADVIDKEGVEHFLERKLARQPTMDCGVDKDAPRDAFGKIKR